MEESDVNKYSKDLDELGIRHEIVQHISTPKISEVLDYLHLTFEDCIPTLIMKGDGEFYAIIFRGDCKVDFKKIKKMMGIKDLRMATPEEFESLTSLPIGAARVFTPGTKTVIDSKVLEKEYLYGGSGRFDCSIKYKTSDLKNIPNSLVSDINQ